MFCNRIKLRKRHLEVDATRRIWNNLACPLLKPKRYKYQEGRKGRKMGEGGDRRTLREAKTAARGRMGNEKRKTSPGNEVFKNKKKEIPGICRVRQEHSKKQKKPFHKQCATLGLHLISRKRLVIRSD